MKTRALVMAGIIALAIMASTRVAQAQQTLVVNVPFDFVAGNTMLPAGEYSVQISGPLQALTLIDRKDANASALINTNAASTGTGSTQTQSKLVFNRYGDRYFLSQVWTAGYAQGRQLRKSDREKESALLAKNQVQDQVTLVASLPPNNR